MSKTLLLILLTPLAIRLRRRCLLSSFKAKAKWRNAQQLSRLVSKKPLTLQ
jgi:hypothetical protein